VLRRIFGLGPFEVADARNFFTPSINFRGRATGSLYEPSKRLIGVAESKTFGLAQLWGNRPVIVSGPQSFKV